MNIFYYLGKAHTAWCNWQGHSNGRLRIKGKRTEGSVDFVFSVSCYKFFFCIFRNKRDDCGMFRKLHIGKHEIYFTRKWKRELFYMSQRIRELRREVETLKEENDLHKSKMSKILWELSKCIKSGEPIDISCYYDKEITKIDDRTFRVPSEKIIVIHKR